MIIGFGNNVVSTIASDITATQTTFSVNPGSGGQFANLLTTDVSNPDSPHGIYAKITITDKQQTVFEICHLTGVSQDALTVIRGQEGTTAKGWSLNDTISNFATRGSEQKFVQSEQLQGGDYTAAKAGGTANALAISLPSTFFDNGATNWQLGTPILVTPIITNTGPATIQVTLSGKVIGTFPLYKGNKATLTAGDLIAGIPFCCVIDQTKTFFNVINPANASRGALLNIQRFGSTGTYTPTPGAKFIRLTLTGGGGGAGGCQASSSNGTYFGAGGGAGATVISQFTLTGAANYPLSIGAGGTGGTAAANGSNGGATTFSTVLSAPGGAGGGKSGVTNTNGGEGGVPTTGDIRINGGYGSDGQSGVISVSGQGGASYFGGGGRAGAGGGVPGAAPGSGGGGAYDSGYSGIAMKGGDGASGLIIIEEYS